MKFTIIIIAFVLILTGCSSPKITSLGNNVYIICSSTAFNGTSQKTRIIEEANEFAASKGKQAVQVSIKEYHPDVGMGGQFEYQFRLEDINDKPAQIGASADKMDEGSKNELQRLEKLKADGVITSEEFETLKVKYTSETHS